MIARWIAASILGLTIAGPVWAADLMPAGPEPAPPPLVLAPGWQFQATLYGWATSLSGDVGVGRLPDAKADQSFLDILQNLDGALMGAFVARNETFILGADLIWSKISDDVNLKEGDGPLAPFRTGSNVSFEQRQTIATAFGGLRLPIGPPRIGPLCDSGCPLSAPEGQRKARASRSRFRARE